MMIRRSGQFARRRVSPAHQGVGRGVVYLCSFVVACLLLPALGGTVLRPWQIGTPIVTYWAGPSLDEKTVSQMAHGGSNLVWCTEKDVDLVHHHRLRGQLPDALITPASL